MNPLTMTLWMMSFLLAGHPQNVSAPLPCEDRAHDQAALNQCAKAEFEGAEIQMEAMFRHVLKKHKDDIAFTDRMTQAQHAWSVFREAEMEALFPHHAQPRYYGSNFSVCWYKNLTSMTCARTEQLRVWIIGLTEGETCSGSRPIKPPPK